MTDQSKLRLFLQFLFILFLTFLIFPSSFYQMPKSGLDSSWNISLHLAHKYNLKFGKDFLFTYGPFGVIYSRLPISVSKYFYLFFDVYFLGTFIFVAWKILKIHFNIAIALFGILIMLIAMYEIQEQWYFFFFLFFLFSFLKEPTGKFGYLVQAALISVFCFYYKVGIGISCLIIFIMVITYAVTSKKLTPKNYIILFLFYLLLIWLCARIFNVDLKGYLQGSLHIINGYNDSMFVPISGVFISYGYATIIVLFVIISWILYRFIISIRKREIFNNRDELFIYIVFSMAVYVLFKSSFVRPDGHLMIFLKSISFITVLLFLFSSGGNAKKVTAICCWVVVLISLWSANSIPGSYKPVNRLLSFSFIPIKIDEMKSYFTGLKNYDTKVANSNKLLLGDNIFRNVIGNHSVDIIPIEISKIYFNGLRYNPRPVIQSYSAYDEYLDSLNWKKYMSADAPEYVLFTLNSIDDRYSFFDETKTKIALLNHYKVIDEVDNELLLKKRDSPKNLIKLKEEESREIKLGEDIPVKKNSDLQVSRIIIEYNLWGKLRRLLYQPPTIKIIFTLENGEIKIFRASKSILEGGVILNKFVDNEQDFQLLIQSDGKLNTNVKSVRFESDPPNKGLVSIARMENTFYRFTKKSETELIEDSISIAAMTNRYKPQLIADNILLQPDSLRYNIEEVSAHGPTIRIIGWAFSEDGNNKDCMVKTILQSGSSVYQLQSEIKYRPDLVDYFKREDIKNAGISSIVSRSQLPPGEYKLGIGIFSPDNRTARIIYTDRKIIVDKPDEIKKINSIEPTFLSKNISYNIELIEEEEGNILIQGWAFVKGDESRNDTTHLILQNQNNTYRVSTTSVKRDDVASAFKDTSLTNSGFSVSFAKEKLLNGEYIIGIEKNYNKSARHGLTFTDKILKIGDGTFTPLPLSQLPTVQKFDAVIDHLTESDEFFTISGWAVENINKLQNSIIQIILKSDTALYSVETNLQSRPDVTKFFKSKINIDNCGFSAKISKKDLKTGKYEIGICVKQKTDSGHVKFTGEVITKK